MHNSILNGNAFTTNNVTADEFETVARSAGTLSVPTVKQALDLLRRIERSKKKG